MARTNAERLPHDAKGLVLAVRGRTSGSTSVCEIVSPGKGCGFIATGLMVQKGLKDFSRASLVVAVNEFRVYFLNGSGGLLRVLGVGLYKPQPFIDTA
jgi:hypothetical protein